MPILAGQIATAAQIEQETTNKPLCVVFSSVGQLITSGGSPVNVVFGSEVHDWPPAGMHEPGGSIITCRKAGLYQATATLIFQNAGIAAGRRALEFWVNGVVQYKGAEVPGHAGGDTVLVGLRYLSLAVNDQVQVRAFQDSGSTLTIVGESFALEYVRE